jgi:hypothetical protein
MHGLFQKAWRVGDDGAWLDRVPGWYALWSYFLRACDASRCIVGKKEDFSPSNLDGAGSETTQAQRAIDSGGVVGSRFMRRSARGTLCSGRLPAGQYSSSSSIQIRSIGSVGAASAIARSVVVGRVRHGSVLDGSSCAEQAAGDRALARIVRIDPCKPTGPSPIPGQMRRRKLTFPSAVPFPPHVAPRHRLPTKLMNDRPMELILILVLLIVLFGAGFEAIIVKAGPSRSAAYSVDPYCRRDRVAGAPAPRGPLLLSFERARLAKP